MRAASSHCLLSAKGVHPGRVRLPAEHQGRRHQNGPGCGAQGTFRQELSRVLHQVGPAGSDRSGPFRRLTLAVYQSELKESSHADLQGALEPAWFIRRASRILLVPEAGRGRLPTQPRHLSSHAGARAIDADAGRGGPCPRPANVQPTVAGRCMRARRSTHPCIISLVVIAAACDAPCGSANQQWRKRRCVSTKETQGGCACACRRESEDYLAVLFQGGWPVT